jgi:hypothetical protein
MYLATASRMGPAAACTRSRSGSDHVGITSTRPCEYQTWVVTIERGCPPCTNLDDRWRTRARSWPVRRCDHTHALCLDQQPSAREDDALNHIAQSSWRGTNVRQRTCHSVLPAPSRGQRFITSLTHSVQERHRSSAARRPATCTSAEHWWSSMTLIMLWIRGRATHSDLLALEGLGA